MPADKVPLLPTDNDRLAAIEERLDRGSERMQLLDEKLDSNTKLTQDSNALMREVLELFAHGKTAIKVLNWIGRTSVRAFILIGKLAAGGLAIWGVFHAFRNGGSPPK